MAEYTGESSNFLSHTFEVTNTALQSFVTGFSANIANEIAPIVMSGLILSFIIIGIMSIRGMLNSPFQEVAWKMLYVSVVISFALTAGTYQKYIIDVFLTMPDDLISSLVSKNLNGQNVVVGQGAAQAIEQLYSSGSYNAGLYFNEAGMTNIPPILYGSMVWVGTVMCVFMGALWLFVSKIVLALLLAVGPLFIVLLCWKPTEQYFYKWASVVVNTVITSIFVIAIFAIFSGIFQEGLKGLEVDNSSEGFMNAAVFAFLGLLCMGVLMVLPNYVAQLTGGAMGAVGTAMASIGGRAASSAGAAKDSVTGGVQSGMAAKDSVGAYKSARQGGETTYQGNRQGNAGRLQAMREARREYHGSMDGMKKGYSNHYRNNSSNTQSKKT